jgi:hypothetical protein
VKLKDSKMYGRLWVPLGLDLDHRLSNQMDHWMHDEQQHLRTRRSLWIRLDLLISDELKELLDS